VTEETETKGEKMRTVEWHVLVVSCVSIWQYAIMVVTQRELSCLYISPSVHPSTLTSVSLEENIQTILTETTIKGLVHFQIKCHPRCLCISFLSRKEIKVFDENIPGFVSI